MFTRHKPDGASTLLPCSAFVLLSCTLSLPAAAAPDLEVRKRVDTPTPVAQQPVEFTVEVRNVGTTQARGVIVTDRLPPELKIPTGLAAFPSAGTYDPTSGDWLVGDLDAGAGASLVVPAIVAVPDPPDCIANIAESKMAVDLNTINNRGAAALRKPGVAACVDVQVRFINVMVGPTVCGPRGTANLEVRVSNVGPDTARNVVVDVMQSGSVAPNLRFSGGTCTGPHCAIGALGPGESVRLIAFSDEFENPTERPYAFSVAASSDGTEYAPDDNLVTRDGSIKPFGSCEDLGDLDGLVAEVGNPACFIATAAYGSPLDAHVQSLRDFRDRYLRTNAPGRAFVRFYYRHSPPIAQYIARHDGTRATTRVVLAPLVFAIAYPEWAMTIAVLLIALYLWRRWVRVTLRARDG